jgi:hypothetical protein
VNIDNTYPQISIETPTNNTNSSDVNLDVNYTYSETNVGSCWYSNDSYLVNNSLANCGTNITSVVWSEGLHNITIWINDSAGNENFTSVSFTIDTIAPSFTDIANISVYDNSSLSYDIMQLMGELDLEVSQSIGQMYSILLQIQVF